MISVSSSEAFRGELRVEDIFRSLASVDASEPQPAVKEDARGILLLTDCTPLTDPLSFSPLVTGSAVRAKSFLLCTGNKCDLFTFLDSSWSS